MGTMDVIVIETPQLGDRSYLVHDGSVALVIDPQRDTDRVEAAAAAPASASPMWPKPTCTTTTSAADWNWPAPTAPATSSTPRTPWRSSGQPITDGQTVQVGSLTVKAVATPGHTHTHLSFIVDDGGQQAVFSGGSLLYGSVGRTDLVAAADTVGLTHDQYASVTAPRRRGRARRRAVPDPRLRLVLLVRPGRRARDPPRSASSWPPTMP